MSNLVDRFLRYVKIDTQSDHHSEQNPSTQKQFVLAQLLFNELHELGLTNIVLNDKCHVHAELPANTSTPTPVIGLNAHLDTSPDLSGENVNPRLVTYQGGDIVLNPETNVVISPEQFPDLDKLIGKTLITTDGNTLLGADDKAGIAEVMSVLEYMSQHPEMEHGAIKVCFTPDEEIGRGVLFLDYETFNPDFAFTIDGGGLGSITYENFNAASAVVNVNGRSIHPGSAKNKLLSAARVAIELDAMLPIEQKPEFTENREGFFHLHEFTGTVENAEVTYIIRDHDRDKFEAKKTLIQSAVDFLNQKYGHDTIQVTLKDSYFNMREKIEDHMHIVETAIEAMKRLNIESEIVPIRGGTDGAHMSFNGIPTPNLFTGGYNAHGRYEFAVVEEMEQSVQTILKIIELYTA